MLILLLYSTLHVSNIHKKIKIKRFMSSIMFVIYTTFLQQITIFYVTIDSGLFDVVWSEPQNDSYNYFNNPDMTLDNTQM